MSLPCPLLGGHGQSRPPAVHTACSMPWTPGASRLDQRWTLRPQAHILGRDSDLLRPGVKRRDEPLLTVLNQRLGRDWAHRAEGRVSPNHVEPVWWGTTRDKEGRWDRKKAGKDWQRETDAKRERPVPWQICFQFNQKWLDRDVCSWVSLCPLQTKECS